MLLSTDTGDDRLGLAYHLLANSNFVAHLVLPGLSSRKPDAVVLNKRSIDPQDLSSTFCSPQWLPLIILRDEHLSLLTRSGLPVVSGLVMVVPTLSLSFNYFYRNYNRSRAIKGKRLVLDAGNHCLMMW